MSDNLFTDLEYLGRSLRQVEQALGMPQNYLSNIKAGRRALPRKWALPLNTYILNAYKEAKDKMVGESSELRFAQPLPKALPLAVPPSGPVLVDYDANTPLPASAYDSARLSSFVGDEVGQFASVDPTPPAVPPADESFTGGLSPFQLALRKKRLGY